MRRSAAVALIAGLLLLLAPLVPAAAADTTTAPSANWLRLDIAQLSPRVVDSGTKSVTITGSVTNTGDRGISHVKMRLQIGSALNDDAAVRSALDGTVSVDRVTPFMPITDSLTPGQHAPVNLTVPVRGVNSLDVSDAGVYPLLVNVNGQPDYGGQTRLAAVGMLLPVVSVPGGQAPPKPVTPARLTLLWPLVDSRPRIVGDDPNGQVILSDDDLADSIGPGGRLFGLLDAVRQFSSGDPSVLSSLCFAIDPDLLYTVEAMAHGYRVRTGGGQSVAGTGGAAAGAWLASLHGLTQGRCVFALPTADADLVALSRGAATNLEQAAVSGGAAEVAAILRPVKPLNTVAWPADGALDISTAANLASQGATTVLLAPDATRPTLATGPTPISGLPAGGLRGVPVDPMLSSALADTSGSQDATGVTAVPVDQPGVAAQNGLAALAYRLVLHQSPGQTMLVAPPRRWNAPETELRAFLGGVQQMFTSQLATPVGLADLVAAPSTGAASALNYRDRANEIPPSVTSTIVQTDARQRDLIAAMTADPTNRQVNPGTLMAPVRLGELQAMSSAWRGGQAGEADSAAQAAVDQLDTLTAQVATSAPAQTISLASNDSKLPVTVDNGLPVDITVRINVGQEAGLRTDSIDNPVIPAKSSRTLFIPAKWTRSGRFSVQASLTTPGGTPLGEPARIELVSSAYGMITLVITGTAFGVLVLLSGWRIYRRVRTRRVPAAASEDQAIGE